MTSQIPYNVKQVLQRIEYARMISGREDPVRLIAATKTQTPEDIDLAAQNGVSEVGENRVQELETKISSVSSKIKWHFIGQLQANKVKYIVEQVCMIHSLDRLSLALEIEKRAENAGLVMPVLVQINIGHEPAKGGIDPDKAEAFVREISTLPHLSIQGLMTVPPVVSDSEMARPYFKALRELLLSLQKKQINGLQQLQELSMGMSHDYEVAIQEGATMVRVGSAIFGERHY